MATGPKKPKTGTFTISSSIFVNEDCVCKNKLCEYDDDWTWYEVLKDISHYTGSYDPCKTDVVSVSVADKPSNMTSCLTFEPDIEEEILVVKEVDSKLKFITFHIKRDTSDLCDNDSRDLNHNKPMNAFAVMMEASSRGLEPAILKDTSGDKFTATHCRERHYSFQIKRCSDPECCRPASREWEWLPDPILDHTGQHFKPLEAVLGTNTTEKDRPSSRNQTVAQEQQGCENRVLVAQNVRSTVVCTECDKPRCVYSKVKLNPRDVRALKHSIEKYDYSCGALIAPGGDLLHGKLFSRLQMSCSSHIEFAYYGSTIGRKDFCAHCAVTDCTKDPEICKKKLKLFFLFANSVLKEIEMFSIEIRLKNEGHYFMQKCFTLSDNTFVY